MQDDKAAGIPGDEEIKAALFAYEGALHDDDSDEETIEPARDALLDVLSRLRDAARSVGSAELHHQDTERLNWIFSARNTPEIVAKIERCYMGDPNRGTFRDAIDAAMRSDASSAIPLIEKKGGSHG